MDTTDLRIGDAERDDAARLLQDHLTAGRLDHDEFSARVAAAIGATHRSQLDGLFADLPGPRPGATVPAAAASPVAVANPAPVRWRPWAIGGLATAGVFGVVGMMLGMVPGAHEHGPMMEHGRGHHGPPGAEAGLAHHGFPWFGLFWLAVVVAGLVWVVAHRVRTAEVNPAAERRAATLTGEQRAAIDRELRAGHRVRAIRLFRRATGASLAEATAAISAWQRRSAAWRA